MEDLDNKFQKAIKLVKDFSQTLPSEELLHLSALYKQANSGENTTTKPSIFNFRALKKWEAWKNVGTVTKDEAKIKYINLATNLSEKYQ